MTTLHTGIPRQSREKFVFSFQNFSIFPVKLLIFLSSAWCGVVWCLVWSHSCVVCSDPCPGGWWWRWRWPALAPLLHTTYLAMGGTVCQARSLISVSLSPSLCPDRNISWRISPLPPLLYPRYPSARNLQLTEFNLIKCFASGSSCSRCLIRKKEAKVQE